ncbi:serine/threonine-protein kinase [Nonomuraea mangrovi]|uniref:non-specific serine/threonine protein kinase n=1 Tax=Nonomuraea mangrovi TaxID=2316207 RepID=A0ABW4TC81_9ACTN
MSGGRLAGRYTLIRPLGSGGMGKVWLARDEMLDREVAVKELTLPEGLDEQGRAEAVARAVREAQATAQLRHPGVVALHDVIVEYGRPWLIMELLRGRTLGEAITQEGALPPATVARIGADVLEALTAAHSRGLQHRDVKPGNVFLTDSGRVVLTDFGIARQEGQATLTQAGLMIGSPGFIAPERLEGEAGGPPSDLWSLGATLFAAAEGVSAYEGTAMERIQATLTMPPRPPHRSGPLAPVLSAMMARHPAARPDPWSTVHALRQVAVGQSAPPLARQDPTVPGVIARPRSRRRWWLWLVPAGAVVVAGAVAAALVFSRGGTAAPTAFTLPVDMCGLLTPSQVGEVLGTGQPPKGVQSVADSDDRLGVSCDWTVSGRGVSVVAQRDSDTPQPWSMTTESARRLMESQRVWIGKYQELQWSWKEIGAKGPFTAKVSKAQPLQGVGEEGYTYELSAQGRVHTAVVMYRVANLVIQVEFTTLASRPTDDQVKRTALTVARQSEQALRSGG